MVLPTEAAFLSCLDIDSIIALIYESQLHVRDIEKKGLYICLTSLCLFKFESEVEDTEHESIKLFAKVQNCDFNFVKEEK